MRRFITAFASLLLVGVEPEIAVAREKALDAALEAARKKISRAALPH